MTFKKSYILLLLTLSTLLCACSKEETVIIEAGDTGNSKVANETLIDVNGDTDTSEVADNTNDNTVEQQVSNTVDVNNTLNGIYFSGNYIYHFNSDDGTFYFSGDNISSYDGVYHVDGDKLTLSYKYLNKIVNENPLADDGTPLTLEMFPLLDENDLPILNEDGTPQYDTEAFEDSKITYEEIIVENEIYTIEYTDYSVILKGNNSNIELIHENSPYNRQIVYY